MAAEDAYLGDGVYASSSKHRYMVSLDLRAQDQSKIALEPEVMDALIKYWIKAYGFCPGVPTAPTE